jgi:hypothetical protein
MDKHGRALAIAGWVVLGMVLGMVLALSFRAYLGPGMLFDFANVRFCS